jgi:hypothetical protein
MNQLVGYEDRTLSDTEIRKIAFLTLKKRMGLSNITVDVMEHLQEFAPPKTITPRRMHQGGFASAVGRPYPSSLAR